MRPPLLLGADLEVPCVDGRPRRYVNLDYAASTPVMADVWEAVEAFVPWYSSVHRGSGAKSQVSTAAFEEARSTVAAFVGARADDQVVFVRNTTEAINVMAAAMPAGTRVLNSPAEHHANMLPWRRHDVRLLPFTSSVEELLDACERRLRKERFDLLAVTRLAAARYRTSAAAGRRRGQARHARRRGLGGRARAPRGGVA